MTRPNDLWDDMATLNSLYSELCWDHDDIIDKIKQVPIQKLFQHGFR